MDNLTNTCGSQPQPVGQQQGSNAVISQLQQLKSVTWDGNLISKSARDTLATAGLVDRAYGFNFITEKGVEYLVNLRLMVP